MSERFERGMQVRREVLGDAHVDATERAETALTEPFQRLLTEAAWGSVWARPELDRRTRSLVTIVLLAALNRQDELAMHLRASRETGATPQEIAEVLLHVAIYAGIPAANTAFELLRRELEARPEQDTS
jgi:4-carboxymuconolactone decarboxylase